jgi:hypothetical protein
VEFPGHLFSLDCVVVVVVSYITRLTWGSHGAYKARFGSDLFALLQTFIVDLRASGKEVLLMGDFNAGTGAESGWSGCDALFSEVPFAGGLRRSECSSGRVDAEGRALLRICETGELRILNGLGAFDASFTRPVDGLVFDVEDDEEHVGRVLDYYLASEAVLASCSRLTVLPMTRFSDHRPVTLAWRGFSRIDWQRISDRGPSSMVGSSVLGWKFSGVPSDPRRRLRELQQVAASEMRKHADTGRVRSILADHGPLEAYRTIHAIIRDSWAQAGAKVAVTDGTSPAEAKDAVADLPVVSWFDDEVAAALLDWHRHRTRLRRLRRTRGPPDSYIRLCAIARHRYRRLRDERQRRWATDWAHFWDDCRCNHVSVWQVIAKLAGRRRGGSCLCSAEEQRQHFAAVGRVRQDSHFNWARAREAERWVDAFVQAGRGTGGEAFLSQARVKCAFKKMRECSPGIDGLSKRWVFPALLAILPEITELFSHVFAHGLGIEEWALGVLVCIKKKGSDLSDLDNFRGIHLLPFFRQWYAMCLLDSLEDLCRANIPEEQQGFLRGGRIYASFLALYSLIEGARLRGSRLFVAFVDVKKAFPSVRRDILLQKLAALGASDSLVRAIWALYDGAVATIRGEGGYGEPYELLVGTREGGVEAPLLYVLFVADLVGFLDEAQLSGDPVLLGGREIRALQLADDVALVATSPEDLQVLLDRWEVYVDRDHQLTQVRKTEVAVFTTREDARRCHAQGCVLRLPAGRAMFRLFEFRYKDLRITVVDSFVYLGVLFASALSAQAAWEAREGSGYKAFGAVKRSLNAAPFIPFHRTLEVSSSTVGGAYLYAAELWGPFITAGGSELGASFSRWMLGFWNTRADRRVGWVALDDLDTQALSRAVRVIEDSVLYGGLLRRAVVQFCTNREAAAPSQRSCTWLGRLLSAVRKVWPSFYVSVGANGAVLAGGAPFRTPGEGPLGPGVAANLRAAVHNERWVGRQVSVLRSAPSLHQQDYVLFHIVCARLGAGIDVANVARQDISTTCIFRTKPSVSTAAFRSLLRFLAGLEDFARINAHYPRRAAFPMLGTDRVKRQCLYCLVRRNVSVLDSEWHALFSCPSCVAPRTLFAHIFPVALDVSEDSCLRLLVTLVVSAGSDTRLTNELSRLVVGVLACRRRTFRALASEIPLLANEP